MNRQLMAQEEADYTFGEILRTKAFDPDEPRDERGRWTTGGSGDYISPSPQEFITARDKSKDSGLLSPLKPEDLSNHTLITTKDMKVGVAVDPKGDLQNLFNNGGPKGAAAPMVTEAITRGAITLDCYDNGFLPGYYRQFGFKETGRMKFNPEFAHNWDSEKYGQPDVVFMAWDGYPNGGEKDAIERATSRDRWIKNDRAGNYATDYDAAKAESHAAAKRAGVRRFVGEVQRSQDDRARNQSFAGTGESHRRAIIAGRKAIFHYFDADLNPTERERATFLKAIYLDDGEQFVARREGKAWQKFDPNEPRDEHGRWTSEGGGEGDHPGHGYSKDAYEDSKGVIHTSNVYDAARALSENRKVELDQVKEISTLIKHLGEVAKNMEILGEKAPLFNLCNVTIKGTNLFCVEAKDITRVEMPVIPAKRTNDFIDHLKSLGYEVEKGKEKAANLRATQKELDGAKVAQQMKRIKKEGFYKRLVVSRDDYILDGHHTWAGELGLDAKDNNLYDDKEVKIARVNISITKLLDVANEWIKEEGIAKKPAGKSFVRFNPYHEPAGSPTGGQFTTGGGEGGGADRVPTEQQYEKVTQSPAFKKWFGDSKEVTKPNGDPKVLYHGSTHDFSEFASKMSNPEGNWGAGFYFSNDPEDVSVNYAGVGPDLNNKVERRADELASEMSNEQIAAGEAKKQALKELVGSGGQVFPVYVKMEKPFIVGETRLDFNSGYDPDKDEQVEPDSGEVVDFIRGIREAAADYHARPIETDNVVGKLEQAALDGMIKASELEKIVREDENLNYITDDQGNLVGTEIFRRGLEEAGFDGIIDKTVFDKFHMSGIHQHTVHYVVFKPTQIKSATGNSGKFDPNDPDIRKGVGRGFG